MALAATRCTANATPLEKPEASLLETARAHFGLRAILSEDAASSLGMLRPGEERLALANVESMFERGFLVLTERRLMYLSSGFVGRKLKVREYPLGDITRVRCPWLSRRWGRFSFTCGVNRTGFPGGSRL